MKKISKDQKLVVLVTTFADSARLYCRKPDYLNYDDPRINGIRPCIQQADGSLKDLCTGEDVSFSENTSELWSVSSGTVFEYPDGQRLLVSRLFDADRTMIVLDKDFTYSQTTMTLRKTKEHQEKKETA